MASIHPEGERNVGSPDRSLEFHLNCHPISGFARHIVAVAAVYLGSEALCRGKKQGKKEIRFTISSNRLLPASLEHLEVDEVADGEDIERAVTMALGSFRARACTRYGVRIVLVHAAHAHVSAFA